MRRKSKLREKRIITALDLGRGYWNLQLAWRQNYTFSGIAYFIWKNNKKRLIFWIVRDFLYDYLLGLSLM